MEEEMTFLPRAQVLTLEEMAELGRAFTELGVTQIRLTGGEPLVRNNIMQLVNALGSLEALDELTITTNGSQLVAKAADLKAAGVKRLNISLDTLDSVQFTELTRTGDLKKVIDGIDAAIAAGFDRIKLNAVIMKHRNQDQVIPLVEFALQRGIDISFIEEMPLGQMATRGRKEELCTSDEIRELISQRFALTSSTVSTGGPSRYWTVSNSSFDSNSSHIGFISPHSDNFCSSCNRVRLTAEGRLLLCLGNEHSVDLKAVMRANPGDREKLKQTIIDAMSVKPERHYFYDDDAEQIVRFMNTTGG
jgi:cyclic pyranopterin phosphate synthase